MNEQQWSDFLAEHTERLIRYANRRGVFGADAEWMVNEVLGRVWLCRARWSAIYKPMALVYRVLYRCCMNVHRDEERNGHAPLEAAEFEAGPSTAVAVDTLAERRAHLERLITRLPPQQRRVIELKFRGVPMNAIAKDMGIERGAAASYLARGLQRLHELRDAEE